MNSQPFVMGLLGDIAAGKSTFVELFKEAMQSCKIAMFRSSDILLSMLKERNLEPSRENFNHMVLELQKDRGPAALSHVMRDLIAQQKESDIVIWDGVRLWPDVEIIEESFDSHMLVYVTAHPHIRWERAKRRTEKAGENNVTFQEFLEREDLPTNRHVKEIGQKADFTIDNSYGLAELKQLIEKLAARMKEKNLVQAC